MKVRLLGTGSADGWPNAFCTCAACVRAAAQGRVRAPTSALVDGRLLLDCGPETPRQALRCGETLARVTHVLVTHDHPDHNGPMALLSRRWAGRREPLTVVGPPSVVAAWREWAGPHDAAAGTVRFVTVTPGDTLTTGPYQVRVLAAHHHVWQPGDAVLYDVADAAGTRLLYSTDTGPLPQRTRSAVAGTAYDLVLIEATFGDRAGPGHPTGEEHQDHLDLSSLGAELATLRADGTVTGRTDVVAVHLSHHSPPDLAARLETLGVRLVDDGAEVTCGGVRDVGPDVPPAPHRTLVVGGARSGKSRIAEQLLAGHQAVTYVATGPLATGDDPEWAERVRRHRERRPEHWATVETSDLAVALRTATTPLLVECLGTWLAAALDRVGAWVEDDEAESMWRKRFTADVDDLVEAWHSVSVPVVLVSNEVGSGVVPATASGRLFRDELGRLTTRLSLASERVLLVVAGRAVDLTGDGVVG